MRRKIIGVIVSLMLATGISATLGAGSAWAGCSGSYANGSGEIVPCR